MNELNSGPRDYKPDYALLELNSRANWKTAQENYRRLVHVWHPDRYTQRPRERAHAQQQFISLTKSYTHLKAFYREHDRLPFEPSNPKPVDETMVTRMQKRTDSGYMHASDADIHTGAIEPGILAREADSLPIYASKPNTKARLLWAFLGCVILAGTVIFFYILDRKANQATVERGRAAILEAPPSDFMPSAAEIRRSEAKGAFVQPPK